MRTIHLALLAILVTGALYGRTLTFGFDWDDYHFVRSYSWTEVARSFVGTWERQQLEAPMYRPLTVGLFALRSWALDSNPVALHAISLVLMSAAGALFASWLARCGWSSPAVMTGLLVFLTHPASSTSMAVWITNQMHLVQVLLVLAALLLATDRSDRWPWLIVLQGLALLVKEDGVMLAPAIAVLWWTRGQRLPTRWVVTSLLLVAFYAVLRTWALGGFGGYGDRPESIFLLWLDAPKSLVGLSSYFFRNWIVAGSLVFLLALAVWSREWRAWRSTLLLASLLFFLFDLPLTLLSGPNRWQLVTVAACAGIAGAVQLVSGQRRQRLGHAAVAVLVVALAWNNWAITSRSAPCAPETRRHDGMVATWPLVPDMAARLAAKERHCGPR